ncbi:MAG: CapA family protein [Pseudomonadales bacterium]|nr:CapA family protein [Pseudomonadales bacterium]
MSAQHKRRQPSNRLLTTLTLVVLTGLTPVVSGQSDLSSLPERDHMMSMSGEFVLASVGDLMIRRPASQLTDPEVQAVFDLIRNADLAVGNMEGELANLREFDGPLNGFVGTHEVAADLKLMGFDMVNRAQNHLLDSEFAGMFSTNSLLDAAGIVHAGSGQNLQEAAAPAFLELPKGRAALIGTHAPIFPEHNRLAATPRIGNLGGRPGLNMLNYSETILVSPQQYDALLQVREGFLQYRDNYDNPRPVGVVSPETGVSLSASSSGRNDPNYRVARGDEIPGTVVYTVNENDVERILRSIRNARQLGDFVIAAAHIHQSQSVVEFQHLSTRPPEFYVELAHKAIDAGADAFVGTGVQTLRGVEIYKGKPIFYGLGEFFRESQWELPIAVAAADADQSRRMQQFSRNFGGSTQSLESLVATSHYQDGVLKEVRLYPTELGIEKPDSRLGIPRMAEQGHAQRILERVTRLSDQWGTNIDVEGNVGIIRVN